MRLISLLALLFIEARGEDGAGVAKKLLASSGEMISAASPQVQVSAHLDLGRVYPKFDQKQAAVHLEQAFALTAGLPESKDDNARSRYQALIVEAMAAVDAAAASQLIQRMVVPEGEHTYRSEAVTKVVNTLLAKKDFDAAMETIATTPDGAEYPFQAADAVMRKLASDDPRRITLFGNATQGYARRPGEGFAPLVDVQWRSVPREMALRAVDLIVNRVLGEKKQPTSFTFTETTEGIELQGPLLKEFVRIWKALYTLDEKRAKEILSARPDLAKAIRNSKPESGRPVSDEMETEPEGEMTALSFLNGFVNSKDQKTFMEIWSRAARKAEELLKVAAKNPQDALDRIGEVEISALRAECIARIAVTQVKGQNAEAAGHALDKAGAMLGELKEPGDRLGPRVAIGEAAMRLKDSKRAIEAFAAAMEDVEQVYRQDTDPKSPNYALREFWPSMQSCRIVAWSAGAAIGVDAVALLPGLRSPDMAVMAQIAVAAGLVKQRLNVDQVLATR